MVVQYADDELELNYLMENLEEVFEDHQAEAVVDHLIHLTGKSNNYLRRDHRYKEVLILVMAP